MGAGGGADYCGKGGGGKGGGLRQYRSEDQQAAPANSLEGLLEGARNSITVTSEPVKIAVKYELSRPESVPQKPLLLRDRIHQFFWGKHNIVKGGK